MLLSDVLFSDLRALCSNLTYQDIKDPRYNWTLLTDLSCSSWSIETDPECTLPE